MGEVQMEDLRQKRDNIQKEYIKYYAFSTNNEKGLYSTLSKESYFDIFQNPVKTRHVARGQKQNHW